MKFSTLRIYYLVTPVFFVLQYFFEINLRLVIPGDSENIIIVYYIICFAASFIVFKNMIVGSIFALIESSVNIFLLLLSVMLPIFNTGNIEPGTTSIKFGVSEIIHFMLVGSVLIYSFYMNPLLLGKKDR